MKILLATDGTKYSSAAVEMISKCNFTGDCELKIISIVDMAVPLTIEIYEGFAPSTLELENAAKENAVKILAETKSQLTDKLPGLSISTEVLLGSPESKIVETAEQMQADLIVVGSHGYNRWERLLLGSVSDSVVHHAPCSVLVVRN
jgi:nucleotide-binding universal stress UspA family protein